MVPVEITICFSDNTETWGKRVSFIWQTDVSDGICLKKVICSNERTTIAYEKMLCDM